jgi:hypothetical protein
MNKGFSSNFTSPSIGSANFNNYSNFSYNSNMSSGINNGKHQTRVHLVENIRQPLFPLMTNETGQVMHQQLPKQKISFDNDDLTKSSNIDFIVCNNKQ